MAVANEQHHDQRTSDGERRRETDVDPPVLGAERIREVRRRFAERQCADENTERKAAACAEPRRNDFHRRRINTREAHARQEAQHDRGGHIVRKESEREIHGRAGKRRNDEKASRADDVRKIEESAQQRSRNKAELDRPARDPIPTHSQSAERQQTRRTTGPWPGARRARGA
jgi:hypothetical protein